MKVVPENNSNVTHQPGDTSPGSPPEQSLSPPRLRGRRSLSIDGKNDCANLTSSTTSHQASSPPSNIKRPSGPTRILPKRSCAATSSLLSSYIATNSSHNRTSKQSTCISPSVSHTSLRNISPCKQLVTSTPRTQQSNGVDCSTDAEMLVVRMITANINNYSRDVPLPKSTAFPRPTKSSGSSLLKSDDLKAKLLRISLPDKTRLSANNPIDLATSSKQTDKNMYMFTMNGLRKVGSESPDKTINDIADNNNSFGESSGVDEIGQTSSSILVKRKTFNVLLAATGSVATLKLLELTKKIESLFPRAYVDKKTGDKMEAHVSIKIVLTKNSMHFVPKNRIQAELADSKIEIFEDDDEWSSWSKLGDPVLHIELRKWADLCIIAPLDANTLAKLANGICDNLLTCIVRAWDTSKPLIYCPAMNVHMYNHPITKEQFIKLQSYSYLRVDCVEKKLACGDVGIGGMASVDSISQKVIDCLMDPISRKVSLTRPLLNQQPTYPITSTSGHRDSALSNPVSSAVMPTIRGSIFDRFKTNNQISIHAVPNSNMQSAGVSLLRSKRKSNIGGSGYKNFALPCVINKLPSTSYINQIRNGRSMMGGVTSVQNLKAMGVDNGSVEVEKESMNDGERTCDVDPTKLLEQSMVTNDYECGSVQGNSFEINFDPVGAGFERTGSPTPLFNTSKFLALCLNKDKGGFTCAICKHDYKNRKSMARHLKEQHIQGNIFQCKPCGVSYKRREKLIKHNRERHPDRI